MGLGLRTEPILKHLKGTVHDHDQSTHGNADGWTRSGIAEIDEAIEAFLREPAGDWTTDECPIGDFTPEQVHGNCQSIADQFAAFATARGLKAYAVDTNLDELGYKVKGKPRGEILDPEGNIVPGHYFTHTVNEIYLDSQVWPVMVDFAARQYGYEGKVLIEKHAPGGVDHDQSTHGNWADGLSVGETKARYVELIEPLQQERSALTRQRREGPYEDRVAIDERRVAIDRELQSLLETRNARFDELDDYGLKPELSENEEPDEYRGQHQPSGEYDSPLHELNRNVPDDIYTHPQYFFTMDAKARQSYDIMRRARGKPNMPVTIYRAVPEGVDEINPGDWVTLTRSYARQHGEGSMGGYTDRDGEWHPNPYTILSRKVKAGEVRWPGDSVAEFGWWPSMIAKHRPGDVEHDQLKHGRRGLGVATGPVLENPVRTIERIDSLEEWLVGFTNIGPKRGNIKVSTIHRELRLDQAPEDAEAKQMYGAIGDQVFMWYQGGDVPTYNDLTGEEVSALVEKLVIASETPLPIDLTLYRGFGSADIGFKPGDDPSSLIGSIADTGGSFMSTSINPRSAQRFALDDLWEKELPVITRIDAPKGTFGTYLEGETPYPNEYEVLLPPGTSVTITGVTVLEKVGYLDNSVLILDATVN